MNRNYGTSTKEVEHDPHSPYQRQEMSATMTKGELRKQRKAARLTGKPLTGALSVLRKQDPLDNDVGNQPCSFSESERGRKALDRWVRYYDDLNGRPEGDWGLLAEMPPCPATGPL